EEGRTIQAQRTAQVGLETHLVGDQRFELEGVGAPWIAAIVGGKTTRLDAPADAGIKQGIRSRLELQAQLAGKFIQRGFAIERLGKGLTGTQVGCHQVVQFAALVLIAKTGYQLQARVELVAELAEYAHGIGVLGIGGASAGESPA